MKKKYDTDKRIMSRAIHNLKERERNLNGIFKQYISVVNSMHYLYLDPTKGMAVRLSIVARSCDH